MPPACAGEEEDRRERGPVDQGGAEVGLEEDEQRSGRARGRAAVATVDQDPIRAALREEAGEREHEEDLPELGRLELERADVDPALGAAHHLAEGEDEHHQPDRAAVENRQPARAATEDRDRDERAGAERRRRSPAARRSSSGRPGRRSA